MAVVSCTENLSFLRYVSRQTNKQTYKHADRNTLHAKWGHSKHGSIILYLVRLCFRM